MSGAVAGSGVTRESLRRRSRWEFHRLRIVLTRRDGSDPRPGVAGVPAVEEVEGVAPTAAPGTRRDTPDPAVWGAAATASVWEFSLMLRRRTLGGWEAAAIKSPSPRGGRVRSAVHELRRRRRCPPLYFIILPTHPDRDRLSGHLKCFPITRVTSSATPAGLTGRSLSGTEVPTRHSGTAGTVRAGDTWAALTGCLTSAHVTRLLEQRLARAWQSGRRSSVAAVCGNHDGRQSHFCGTCLFRDTSAAPASSETQQHPDSPASHHAHTLPATTLRGHTRTTVAKQHTSAVVVGYKCQQVTEKLVT